MISYPDARVRLSIVLNTDDDEFPVFLPAGWGAGIPDILRRTGDAADRAAGAALEFLAGREPSIIELELPPVSARWKYATYAEPDEAEVTLDLTAFPFDPRLARAIHLSVWFGDRGGAANNLPMTDENRVFTGIADYAAWQIGPERIFRIRAFDYSGLLSQQPWTGAQINWGKPVDEIVRDILSLSPFGRSLAVQYRGDGAVPVPGASKTEGAGGVANVSSKTNLWELIITVCTEAGLMVWLEGTSIIMGATQHQDGTAAVFEYGFNVETMDPERRLGNWTAPVVQVVSWDTDNKTRHEATWPVQAKPELDGRGVPVSARPLRFRIPNESDPEVLLAFAKTFYRRFRDIDVAIVITTRELDATGAVWRLRPGLEVQAFFSAEERVFLQAKTLSERVTILTERGVDPGIASKIARAYGNLKSSYRVTESEHEFSVTNGYSARITAGGLI